MVYQRRAQTPERTATQNPGRFPAGFKHPDESAGRPRIDHTKSVSGRAAKSRVQPDRIWTNGHSGNFGFGKLGDANEEQLRRVILKRLHLSDAATEQLLNVTEGFYCRKRGVLFKH